MKKRTRFYPLTRLPDETDATLFLIREELKSRHFFNTLEDAALHDCYFQVHLDQLIMLYVGLDDGMDETFTIYSEIMERRSKKITEDFNTTTKQAIKAYSELIAYFYVKGISFSLWQLRF